MSNNPADIVNQALDAAGVDFTIGNLQDGTRPSQVSLRAYGQCLRQLLRAVHWDFARQVSPMTLLADASGQTADVGTTVIAPWAYEYEYPVNCMKARFVPMNYLNQTATPTGNIALPTTPQTTVSQAPYGTGMRLMPSSFLISIDTNYPIDPASNWAEIQGQSPAGRMVVLSNVQQANLVYTALMPYPSMWDAQFRAAMVAYLASEIAMPLAKDKKFGLQMRGEQIKIAKDKIMAARVTNGNESAYRQTTDHIPDWMQARARGAGGGGPDGFGLGSNLGNSGVLGYGWDACAFGDGSVY